MIVCLESRRSLIPQFLLNDWFVLENAALARTG
jgi:hypothetical protein